MKRLLYILCLIASLLPVACSDDPQETPSSPSPMLVVVYPIDGLGDRSYVDNIYRGVEKAALKYDLRVQHLMPYSYEEGAAYVEAMMHPEAEEPGRRLYLIAEPSYEELVTRLAPGWEESENRQMLLLETRSTIPNIHTLYVPFYGVNYAAGCLAQQMDDVEGVAIFCANNQLAILREAAQGFSDGFAAEAGQRMDTYYLDEGNQGFAMADKLYQEAYRIDEHYDLVLPLCGGSAQGLFRYNREYPDTSFYTVGVDADMSIYAERVPFSCVKHMDSVVMHCVEQWLEGGLPLHQSLGLEEGFTELVLAERYAPQFRDVLPQVTAAAIGQELAFEKQQESAE